MEYDRAPLTRGLDEKYLGKFSLGILDLQTQSSNKIPFF